MPLISAIPIKVLKIIRPNHWVASTYHSFTPAISTRKSCMSHRVQVYSINSSATSFLSYHFIQRPFPVKLITELSFKYHIYIKLGEKTSIIFKLFLFIFSKIKLIKKINNNCLVLIKWMVKHLGLWSQNSWLESSVATVNLWYLMQVT